MFPSSIVDHYHHDRAQASTSDDKDRVWRMYARAVIEEDARRGNAIGDPFIVWRRSVRDVEHWSCACGKTRLVQGREPLDVHCEPCGQPLDQYNQGLSRAYIGYWRALPLDDLKALWVALERARHRVAS